MAKQILYWLMGDRTARILLACWHWLWGKPIAMSSDIAKEVAQESLAAMQQSVQQLTEAAATCTAAYQQALDIYHTKQREGQAAEQQALLAHQQDKTEAAHLAMARAIAIENLLPQLQERVTQAEQVVQQTKAKLNREHQRLENYQIQMHNLQALAEVNKALNTIAKTTTSLGLETARSQFEAAETALKHQHYKGKAYVELAENPAETLQSELNSLTLNDKIAQRLQQLSTSLPAQEELS